ncbi:MAG TPA: NosD domain-containing protein [Tepidiformaceae bacterium]|nr:NosD domain-containing protein [Tepidiformaceae bacterium]
MHDLFRLAGGPGRVRISTLIAVILAGALAAWASAGMAHAQSQSPGSGTNPSFETGDISGWTADARCDNVDNGGCGVPPGYAKAVQSFGPDAGTFGPGPNGADLFPTYTAPYGKYFAVLQVGCLSTTLSQTFTLKAGEKITGQAFFATDEDYGLNGHIYSDTGSVEVVSGGTVTTVFASSSQAVRAFGGTPWTPFSYTAPADGDYTVQAYIENFENCTYPSWVGIDLAIPQCTMTCYVDGATGDDALHGGSSPSDAFKTIQQALNTVSTGGTVIVAAGAYSEPVSIQRSVVLEGAQAGTDARSRHSETSETIINNGEGADGFTIGYAPKVTVDGFTFAGNAAGIAIRGSTSTSQYQFVNNMFTGNTTGIAFGGGNYSAVIQQNVFASNNLATPIGNSFVRSGVGIGGGGYLYNSTISDNTFSGQSRSDVTVPLIAG